MIITPLPLISNLLNIPWKACIFTEIDLHHTYHLLHSLWFIQVAGYAIWTH